MQIKNYKLVITINLKQKFIHVFMYLKCQRRLIWGLLMESEVMKIIYHNFLYQIELILGYISHIYHTWASSSSFCFASSCSWALASSSCATTKRASWSFKLACDTHMKYGNKCIKRCNKIFKRDLIFLFSKHALNWSHMTVKTLKLFLKVKFQHLFNFFVCYFELSFRRA